MEYELRSTVDALPGLVWTALPDGRIEFVNRPWSDYTGLSVEHACGEGWQSAVHPEDRPALLEAWRAVVASGVQGELEARMRRFDGTYRWFLCRVSPVVDAAGKVAKWCGINTDIEDRKQAEAALKAHEERFRLIVDGLPTRVILFTPDGDVFQANRHTLKYSGATLEELKQWTSRDFTHPDDRRATVARFYASLRTGEPYDFESRHRRADGVYRWFRVQGFPLQDKEGRIALWYFLQTDIDERKRAEALLAGEKRLLEMIAMGLPLPTVLDDLCRLVEQIVSDCFCSIALIEPGDMTFQQVNAAGLALTYTYPSSGGRVHLDLGPCGLAASRSEQVVVSDIASDSRWPTAWRDLSLAHGLRACWATPILSRTNEVLGTFTLFRSEPGTPSPFQSDLTGRLTHLASIAIERAQGELALKRSEERFRAIVDTTPDCVTVLANDGTVWYRANAPEHHQISRYRPVRHEERGRQRPRTGQEGSYRWLSSGQDLADVSFQEVVEATRVTRCHAGTVDHTGAWLRVCALWPMTVGAKFGNDILPFGCELARKRTMAIVRSWVSRRRSKSVEWQRGQQQLCALRLR
ncbi:PAS domain S-box protein [Paraburkholderia nodosa]|uniref:PAS domain S-box protein n=1 Tax=Paraburkholderia nodosa TaxID=392320 RepID=UPI0009F273A3|nr:PAS domain S-box protein [Paraburkholderia nodosa]